eukprot:TRINITY_DN12129_c1_g3_i2.p1 TRINITY_DN12129_c1_g3~~TRINITY_DN12129_c1_g3_i2.p1  ORF type:complete len:116 (-),score=2.74 TRINITY_DN12129_c1_g3_i2:491-838(-)
MVVWMEACLQSSLSDVFATSDKATSSLVKWDYQLRRHRSIQLGRSKGRIQLVAHSIIIDNELHGKLFVEILLLMAQLSSVYPACLGRHSTLRPRRSRSFGADMPVSGIQANWMLR